MYMYVINQSTLSQATAQYCSTAAIKNLTVIINNKCTLFSGTLLQIMPRIGTNYCGTVRNKRFGKTFVVNNFCKFGEHINFMLQWLDFIIAAAAQCCGFAREKLTNVSIIVCTSLTVHTQAVLYRINTKIHIAYIM